MDYCYVRAFYLNGNMLLLLPTLYCYVGNAALALRGCWFLYQYLRTSARTRSLFDGWKDGRIGAAGCFLLFFSSRTEEAGWRMEGRQSI